MPAYPEIPPRADCRGSIGRYRTAPTPSYWNLVLTMLRRLKERKISVLLCGMVAPPNLGAEYGRAFNSIFPDLAAETGAILYPFFLSGVATDPKLNQRDGLHPTAAGVAVIVDRILPQVEHLIARAKASQAP